MLREAIIHAVPNSTLSVPDEPGTARDVGTFNNFIIPTDQRQPMKIKKKRSLPGNPDPDAEVIALSPKTLLATNRYVCEICNKGFQRDQNLQLHRRGHNLPWKLKQRSSSSKETRKRAYVCPEPTCLHHHPSRALGDLTGIKKHYCRKHGEKKWKCVKCSRVYAVQSDWKAHSKTCGSREYRCSDCGTLFTRKDSFITHRAYCDALAQESVRLYGATAAILIPPNPNITTHIVGPLPVPPPSSICNHFPSPASVHVKHEGFQYTNAIPLSSPTELYQLQDTRQMMIGSPFGNFHVSTSDHGQQLSATALLQMSTATMGGDHMSSAMHVASAWRGSTDGFMTRDFLGLDGVEFPMHDVVHNSSLLKNIGFGFAESCSSDWGNC